MNIIQKIKELFTIPDNTPTLSEMIEILNNSYHFTLYEESLIDAIYTELLPYGTINVTKISKYIYVLRVFTPIENSELTLEHIYIVTESGINKITNDELNELKAKDAQFIIS